MPIKTLSKFYKVMQSLREVRARMFLAITNGNILDIKDIKYLEEVKFKLDNIPKNGKYFELKTSQDQSIQLELDYELNELKKDELFLKYGHKALIEYMAKIHQGFSSQLSEGMDFLKKHNYKHFITDRDGTVSNYCGRYQSSIQPIYNAVCLSGFAKNIEGKSIILTSAPLFDIGLADISIQREEEFILAGSKGREMLVKGEKNVYPIAKDEQEKLNELNQAIEELLNDEDYAAFRYIGSGLQYKFGQTTLARQDKNKSIAKEKSQSLKKRIQELLKELDPENKFFSLEDTGKDLEIMLNIKSDNDDIEEFDKGHGLKFIFNHLNENINNEHVLVCGDTASDVPLISAAQELGAKVTSVFVTNDEALKKSVKSICKDSFFVSSPDILMYMLFKYSKNQNSWNPLSIFLSLIN